ncbi:MAG TPA: HDIG domain-containing protein [Gemmatimonadales bacterium]|nr:HDIG domain-containing protein [Gemmatimonadales bacterium]
MSERAVAFPADMPRHGGGRLRRRDHALRWGLLVGVALLTRLAFPAPAGTGTPVFAAGEVSDRDVVAPRTFEVRKSAEEVRREAAALADAVRPVYRFQPAALDSSRVALDRLLAAALDTARPAPPLAPEDREWLAAPGRRRALRDALDGFLARYLGEGVADAGVILAEPSAEIVLQRDGREQVVRRDSVLTFADFVDRADFALPRVRGEDARRVFRKFAAAAFRPSILPDVVETEARRAEARTSVDSVKAVVPAGERIVAARQVVSESTREKLLALRAVEERMAVRTGVLRDEVAPVLYNFTILSVVWLLLALYRRETWSDLRQMGFLAGLLAVAVVGAAGVTRLFPDRPELLPVPLAVLLVTLLYNGRLGVIVALVLAVLLGGQWTLQDENALYFALVGGSAAALAVRVVRRRAHLFRVVWLTWAGYLLAAVTLGLTLGWTPGAIAVSGMTGLVSAVACTALALLALPVAEWVTRITTDFTLVELADPSRPLLRRLATEAPGTYAHSLMLANMCEAAADAIGANGLLARVGCYYHDVGKLRRPQYYVENQAGASNPHDKLKPQQSAQLIRNHVREGVELAQEARLPPVLQAFIAEHHGTAPITYFLERARERDPSFNPDAPEFRYPGPRPRSRETALVMLGDSVEAGVRVLGERTPERVRAAIVHLVDAKVASGQLDDAPLTLRDLDVVKDTFSRVLAGVHHPRVGYPSGAGGVTADFGAPGAAPDA